jgi:SOS-response transcriptional repressor LexA
LEESGCSASEPFALRVLGDMMEPEFKDGCIIIVDPEGLVQDGCYVVAQHEEEFYFRQLRIEGDRYFLKCVNEGYDEYLEIPGIEAIHGVVSQRAGTRREYRKHYL